MGQQHRALRNPAAQPLGGNGLLCLIAFVETIQQLLGEPLAPARPCGSHRDRLSYRNSRHLVAGANAVCIDSTLQ